jgi:hypothetical protein
LDEVASREKPVRDKLRGALREEREAIQLRAEDVRDEVKALSQQYAHQEEDAQHLYADLEAQLQRGDKLSPAEKVIAWHCSRRGLKTPVIAETLRNYQLGRLTAETPLPRAGQTAQPTEKRQQTRAFRLLGVIGAPGPGRSGLTLAVAIAARLAEARSESSARANLFEKAGR